MEQTNIERFDETAISILSYLYQKFPTPEGLNPTLIGMSDEEGTQDETGSMIYSKEWRNLNDFVRHTAAWLAEEGYLSERTGRSGNAYTLSSIGLKALKRVPQPDFDSATLGETIKGASTEVLKSTASKLMDQFLAIGVPLAASSLGS